MVNTPNNQVLLVIFRNECKGNKSVKKIYEINTETMKLIIDFMLEYEST